MTPAFATVPHQTASHSCSAQHLPRSGWRWAPLPFCPSAPPPGHLLLPRTCRESGLTWVTSLGPQTPISRCYLHSDAAVLGVPRGRGLSGSLWNQVTRTEHAHKQGCPGAVGGWSCPSADPMGHKGLLPPDRTHMKFVQGRNLGVGRTQSRWGAWPGGGGTQGLPGCPDTARTPGPSTDLCLAPQGLQERCQVQ